MKSRKGCVIVPGADASSDKPPEACGKIHIELDALRDTAEKLEKALTVLWEALTPVRDPAVGPDLGESELEEKGSPVRLRLRALREHLDCLAIRAQACSEALEI